MRYEKVVLSSVQIKEQSPELAKRSHVLKVSLDKVYDFALDPQAAKVAEGVIFRFMPDAQQVQHALSVRLQKSNLRLDSRSLPLHTRCRDVVESGE